MNVTPCSLDRKGGNTFQINQTLPPGAQWSTALFWNEQTGSCSVLAESTTLTQVSISVMLNNKTNIGTWKAQVSQRSAQKGSIDILASISIV